MKTKIVSLFIVLLFTLGSTYAQKRVIAKTTSYDISDNLDLEAVVSLFGDSKNLEDFEQRLNDPDNQISNLDLNGDGYIDYLRVVEASTEGSYLVIIQAVIGENSYQDIATLDVENTHNAKRQIIIIGDPYMYGPDYVIEPVFIHSPVIFDFFWGPHYKPWNSPYYWGYYPPVYHHRKPFSTVRYRQNIRMHKNVNASYRYVPDRKSNAYEKLQNQIRRNDYESKNPDRSFSKRNENARNKYELNQKRKAIGTNSGNSNNINKSTGKRVQSVGTPTQNRNTKQEVAKSRTGSATPMQSKPTTNPTQRKSTINPGSNRKVSSPSEKPKVESTRSNPDSKARSTNKINQRSRNNKEKQDNTNDKAKENPRK